MCYALHLEYGPNSRQYTSCLIEQVLRNAASLPSTSKQPATRLNMAVSGRRWSRPDCGGAVHISREGANGDELYCARWDTFLADERSDCR
jgi:hypothetical protein